MGIGIRILVQTKFTAAADVVFVLDEMWRVQEMTSFQSTAKLSWLDDTVKVIEVIDNAGVWLSCLNKTMSSRFPFLKSWMGKENNPFHIILLLKMWAPNWIWTEKP